MTPHSPATALPSGSASAPVSARAKPRHEAPIVVVDDDPSLVESLLAVLRAEGYRAEGFTDPHTALARLRRGPRAALVLADCVMPRMSGGELLDALTASGVDTPVLLMTALSDPNFCVRPGRATILSKPFSIDDLLAEIEAHVRPASVAARARS